MVEKLIYRYFLFHNIFVFIILISSLLLAQDHFQVEIENTGLSQLFIFEESIIGLGIGDEIGIFDGNAITNHGDCSDQRDTLLVGAGVWIGEQLDITAFGSFNNDRTIHLNTKLVISGSSGCIYISSNKKFKFNNGNFLRDIV